MKIMPLWVILLLPALISACAVPQPVNARESVTCGGLQVLGNLDFRTQTCAALALLEQKDGAAYEKIQTYVGIIEQGEHSGLWAWEKPPRYEVGEQTAFASLTWYASTIAHDATHAQLYTEYQTSHPGESVPEEVYNSAEVERFCIAYQLEVLKKIGAPQSEIDYLASLDGTHCDLDGDGDCDMKDYELRNW